MKLILVILGIGVAFVNTSNISDAEVITRIDELTLANSSEEQLWMRPVFPRRPQKFLLTTKLPRANVTNSVYRISKKPVFKIVNKAVKMKNKSYWKTATKRPSLMKNIKFTVNPFTTFNTKRYSTSFNKRLDKDESSEETLESFRGKNHKNQIKNVKKLIHRFHSLQSKISNEKYTNNISKLDETDHKLNMNKNVTGDKTKPNELELSSEEKEDRKEFIFVIPKKTNENTENSEESGETTTMVLEKESKLRQKRSNNIIEEENLGTTVSGFKFTGKPASMSGDIVFRNINT